GPEYGARRLPPWADIIRAVIWLSCADVMLRPARTPPDTLKENAFAAEPGTSGCDRPGVEQFSHGGGPAGAGRVTDSGRAVRESSARCRAGRAQLHYRRRARAGAGMPGPVCPAHPRRTAYRRA